jgi:hypothetical protein
MVLVSFPKAVFSSMHAIAHPVITATKWLIYSCFVWKNIGADIVGYSRDCQKYARESHLYRFSPG